jgi:hypothetical protein
VTGRPATSCRRHRPVLVDLVDRGERGPGTPAALDHLAVCGACERELTELALTIAALRRAGTAYRALRVPETAPAAARLVPAGRAQATPLRKPDWGRRLQLGSLLTSAGIAAMLVAPHVGLVPEPPITDAAPARKPAVVVPWQQAERRLAATPDPGSRAVLVLPPRYPEGLLRPWKEVPAPDASPRELEPS